jgi:hypothetical protein
MKKEAHMSITVNDKIEKLAAIFAKCVEINGLEAHTHSDNNEPNVFFDYSGHVSNIRIYWYINGWSKGLHWDGEITFRIRDIDAGCVCEECYTNNIKQSRYQCVMNMLEKLQNNVSEVALDADEGNLANIKKLNPGEVFLLKTPIDTVVRGVVEIVPGGQRRYAIPRFKPNKTKFTFAEIKKHMDYLQQLKRGA